MTNISNTEAQVAIVSIDEIFEGERFREDYGDIESLVHSIKEKGLIQPLAVCLDDKGYRLLAGGRRYQALRQIGSKHVPVRIYPNVLTNLELRSIELEENIKRKDLTWEEEIKLTKEIHDLQTTIYGKKVSTSPDAPGHSLRDTAKLVNESAAGVSKKLKVARAMEEFPDMGWHKCKNQSEAEKLLKKVTRHIVRDDLANKARSKYTDKKTAIANSYIIKDFFKAENDLPDGVFNLVELDPPYGIDLTNKKKSYDYEGYHDVAYDKYYDFMLRTLKICYKKMSPNSWLLLWFAPEPWFEMMYQCLIEAKFEAHRMCGIWNKRSGQTNIPSKRLANSYEMFFYAMKGNPELAKPGRSNVFEYTVSSGRKFHPAQRPVAMYEDVLTTFVEPNSRVLVPFAGSGASLIAAGKQDMHPIGYDLTLQYKKEFEIWLGEEL